MGFIEYIKETKAELRHVSWPTKNQATVLTVAVIIISLLTAAYTGLLDEIFIKIIEIFA